MYLLGLIIVNPNDMMHICEVLAWIKKSWQQNYILQKKPLNT